MVALTDESVSQFCASIYPGVRPLWRLGKSAPELETLCQYEHWHKDSS